MSVNDAATSSITLESSIILLEWTIMLLESSIMLLESSIMLLESSITLLENIYRTGITHNHHRMLFVIFLYYRPQVSRLYFRLFIVLRGQNFFGVKNSRTAAQKTHKEFENKKYPFPHIFMIVNQANTLCYKPFSSHAPLYFCLIS